MSGGSSELDWFNLYAHVIASTGWRWADVDELTVPRYEALARYWSDHPPVHMLVQRLADAYLEPSADASPSQFSPQFEDDAGSARANENEASIAQMLAAFGGG